jgi:hypothetical protein
MVGLAGLAGCSAGASDTDGAAPEAANASETDDLGTPLAVSAQSLAEAERIVSRFKNLQVSRDAQGAHVRFDDSGQHYVYDFEFGDNAQGLLEPPPSDNVPGTAERATKIHLTYKTEWHWWGVKYRLNRGETRDLVTEGNNAAVLYAIGAAFGCGACAVGAAIEANWAGQANRFYNEGDCIHLNLPYFTTGRTKRNTHNCR